MANAKAEQPCQNYVGNLGGGLRAQVVCLGCGWQRGEHPPDEGIEKWLASREEPASTAPALPKHLRGDAP